MIGIYKITNPNGRVYIGQSIDINSRLSVYKNNRCKGQVRLHASISKYGWDKHKFEILTECSLDELNDFERYYQELFNTLSKGGLNCHYTGTGSRKMLHSEETKLKIGQSQIGKHPRNGFKLTEDHKAKIGASKIGKKRYDMVNVILNTNQKRKEMGLANPFLGRKHTEETKNVLSQIRKGKNIGKDNVSSKVVFDTFTGVFYESVTELAELYNIRPSILSRKLSGARKNDTQFIY